MLWSDGSFKINTGIRYSRKLTKQCTLFLLDSRVTTLANPNRLLRDIGAWAMSETGSIISRRVMIVRDEILTGPTQTGADSPLDMERVPVGDCFKSRRKLMERRRFLELEPCLALILNRQADESRTRCTDLDVQSFSRQQPMILHAVCQNGHPLIPHSARRDS
jgi:hypothetical protein